jgi:hypothetical protein
MTITPKQLRNYLVSYYVSTWRSHGVTVTLQEMMSQTFSFNNDSLGDGVEHDHEKVQADEVYLSLKHSSSYLRVRFDNSVPKDPGLKGHYVDLQAFMVKNPSVVVEMGILLDEEIERHALLPLLASKPVVQMNMREKVCPEDTPG